MGEILARNLPSAGRSEAPPPTRPGNHFFVRIRANMEFVKEYGLSPLSLPVGISRSGMGGSAEL
jgi:hypothetical protein